MFSQVTEKMKKKKFLLLIKQYPHRANIFICMFKRSLPMKAEGKRYEIVENTLLLKTLGNCRILLIGNGGIWKFFILSNGKITLISLSFYPRL